MPLMNWAEIAKDFPLAYETWMESGEDIMEYVKKFGIVAYLYDPSVTGQGWMWEVKYLDRDWNVVSACDAVVTTEEHAYFRMMWRIFHVIENNDSITMSDYKKADKDFTPEDWKKAVKEVDGLMSMYTKAAVRRHKRNKWFTKKGIK